MPWMRHIYMECYANFVEERLCTLVPNLLYLQITIISAFDDELF